MNEPVWVLDAVAIAIHSEVLSAHGGPAGIRDKALLESALARARQKHEYAPGSSVFELAAAYAYGIARNHPFVDGNKRTVFTVGALFLELNGYRLTASEAEAAVVFKNLASGDLDEPALAAWYEANSPPEPNSLG